MSDLGSWDIDVDDDRLFVEPLEMPISARKAYSNAAVLTGARKRSAVQTLDGPIRRVQIEADRPMRRIPTRIRPSGAVYHGRGLRGCR